VQRLGKRTGAEMTVIWVALIGIAITPQRAALLSDASPTSHQGAFLHMAADAVVSFGS